MASFADDDDAAAVDAILKQAPSSKIPEILEEASKRGLDVRSDDLARALDEADPLREYRQQFCFPPPHNCLLYTSPSPRDAHESRMPSSA